MALIHFRSLSRWIGSYTRYASDSEIDKVLFPAPLEVDRFFYPRFRKEYLCLNLCVSVPSRGGQVLIISKESVINEKDLGLFPSTLEVDRFLYQSNDYIKNNFEELVSVPSRGEQGVLQCLVCTFQ